MFGVKVVGSVLIDRRINPIFTQSPMKHVFLVLLFATFLACQSQSTSPFAAERLQTGAEQTELYLETLRGKRVGIIANQTSLIGNTHLVDTLLSMGVEVTKVFAPEHGFRGEAGAGEHIADGKDPKTGLEVLSLYGKLKKPTPAMLEKTDILLFDIQDVGTRFYTYISTLHYILEAAGENDLEVIILDRPNPNGHYIDGPVLDMKFRSFVGMHPIPIVHGLTIGELTQMILGENWIKKEPTVKIIPCKSYTHRDYYSLPVRPSPNLPNDRAIALYPSLCWFEGTEVSVGRGTPNPFQIIGFPGCSADTFTFTPADIPGVAMDPPFENKRCSGLDLRDTSTNQKRFIELELDWLIAMYQASPDKDSFFLSSGFFDKLCGNSTVRDMVIAGKSASEIRASWQSDLLSYKSMRIKYLLYPD